MPGGGSTDYPHELSGGQNQRVMIAMALAGQPDLLVADEPTTALDATIQAQILDLLGRIRRETGMALVLISHDLGVVAENCDRVAVMYAGRIVEEAPATELFADAAPSLYAAGCWRRCRRSTARAGGWPPSPAPCRIRAMPPGCAFAPRCPVAEPRCGHAIRRRCRASACCTARPAMRASRPAASVRAAGAGRGMTRRCSKATDLRRDYRVRAGRGLFAAKAAVLRAVDGVSLRLIRPADTLGLVGESGCGKSTTGRLVLGLERPTPAPCASTARPCRRPAAPAWRALRARMQMVFQDPLGALDRRLPVGAQVTEPLDIHGIGDAPERPRARGGTAARGRACAATRAAAIRTNSPAASASASCWRARSRPSPTCWSATSRSARSTSRSRRR